MKVKKCFQKIENRLKNFYNGWKGLRKDKKGLKKVKQKFERSNKWGLKQVKKG